MKLHLTPSQIEVLKRAAEQTIEIWDDSGATEQSDVSDRFILKDILTRLNGPRELYDFRMNGTVLGEDGRLICGIDSDGHASGPSEDFDAELVKENLLWQFQHPEYTNFPTVNDWASHIDVLKLIADSVDQDWENGSTVLVIDGRRLVFSDGRVEENPEVKP